MTALLLSLPQGLIAGSTPDAPPQDAGAPRAELQRAATRLFVANEGQWDSTAAFRIAAAGATAWLMDDGLALDLQRAEEVHARTTDGPGAFEPSHYTAARARLLFAGAAPGRPIGEARHPARANFYFGSDQTAWRRDVPMFTGARWSQPWPGIAVRARTHDDGLLEFVLEVAPGIDPRTAVLRWEGIEAIERQPDGSLRLSTAAGPLLQSAPVAWQPRPDGTSLPVAAAVELLEEGRFRFRVEVVRTDLPVVIDPVLSYHGSTGTEGGLGVARDATGLTVVAGLTDSPMWVSGLPTAGGRDVFVSCFDFTQTPPTLVWTTTVGGSLDDRAFDVDVDVAGFVTVVGATFSGNFPTTPGVLQPLFGGIFDGFVLQLTAGGAMNFATYFGGPGNDWCCRVETDAQLQATVGGYTDSTTIPAVNAFQPTIGGLRDAFVIRYAPFGASYVYATYLGGAANEGVLPAPFSSDARVLGLDLDAAGRVLLTGSTTSANFPTMNPYQPAIAGGQDAFVTVLDPSQLPVNQLAYSSYLGGASGEGGVAARFGPGGTIVVGGYTYSSNFPTTPGAYQPTFVGPANFNDAFLLFLDPGQPVQLTYGTFFGGAGTGSVHYDGVMGLDVDDRGHVTIAGMICGSAPWPLHVGAFQPVHGGLRDCYVARLRPISPGVMALTYATFLGSSGDEIFWDSETDPDGGVAVAGYTTSLAIPGVSGTLSGLQDAPVGTFEVLPVGVTRGLGSSPYCAGTSNQGTIMLEVNRQPAAGLPFDFLIGGTQPSSFGLLGLNFGPPAPPVPFLGASLCLALAPPPVAILLVSSPLGAASHPLFVPPGYPIPLGIHAQVVWLAPATCAMFASSATLSL